MRALLDTNILISYLLISENPQSPITRTVEAGLAGKYTLLVTLQLFEELERTVERKDYLAKRIPREDLDTFVELLSEAAEAIPPVTEPIPSVVRDPKDDYLLAHALMADAKYVVSGDKDLLTLEEVAGITFVTAGEFVTLLADEL